MVPKITQKPPNFKRLLVPKRAHLHWAQDQGAIKRDIIFIQASTELRHTNSKTN